MCRHAIFMGTGTGTGSGTKLVTVPKLACLRVVPTIRIGTFFMFEGYVQEACIH